MGLKIISTGRSVPENPVSNKQFEAFLDTDDRWITTRTGIKTRYISSGETLTQLGINAAESALEKAGIGIGEIDLVLCATTCGDFIFPSLACCIAERLKTRCPAFDLNAACSGFVYALDVADCYISCGRAKNVLIICAEMMSSLVDWHDRSTCILFGDGAAACVVTEGTALKYINLTANGNTEILNLPFGSGNNPFKKQTQTGFAQMRGQDVFKFAVSMVESESLSALSRLGMTADDIDYFVLHQANRRIIETIRARMEQSEEKFPINIDRYGNISSVSVPLLLDEMLEDGKIKKGSRLLLSAFGAGLTTGTCVLIWE